MRPNHPKEEKARKTKTFSNRQTRVFRHSTFPTPFPAGVCRKPGTFKEANMKLLQKEIWDESGEPWGVLVGCILLNRSKYGPAKDAWDKMKKWYPNSLKMSRSNLRILEGTMSQLGLQTVRAAYLRDMSREYIKREWLRGMWLIGADASTLPGCGGFAKDAWNLIVIGNLKSEVGDRYLEKWRKWKITQ